MPASLLPSPRATGGGHAKCQLINRRIVLGPDDLSLSFYHRARLLLPNHALHAARVGLVWRGVETNFSAPAEAWFNDFMAAGQPVEPITSAAKV